MRINKNFILHLCFFTLVIISYQNCGQSFKSLGSTSTVIASGQNSSTQIHTDYINEDGEVYQCQDTNGNILTIGETQTIDCDNSGGSRVLQCQTSGRLVEIGNSCTSTINNNSCSHPQGGLALTIGQSITVANCPTGTTGSITYACNRISGTASLQELSRQCQTSQQPTDLFENQTEMCHLNGVNIPLEEQITSPCSSSNMTGNMILTCKKINNQLRLVQTTNTCQTSTTSNTGTTNNLNHEWIVGNWSNSCGSGQWEVGAFNQCQSATANACGIAGFGFQSREVSCSSQRQSQQRQLECRNKTTGQVVNDSFCVGLQKPQFTATRSCPSNCSGSRPTNQRECTLCRWSLQNYDTDKNSLLTNYVVQGRDPYVYRLKRIPKEKIMWHVENEANMANLQQFWMTSHNDGKQFHIDVRRAKVCIGSTVETTDSSLSNLDSCTQKDKFALAYWQADIKNWAPEGVCPVGQAPTVENIYRCVHCPSGRWEKEDRFIHDNNVRSAKDNWVCLD